MMHNHAFIVPSVTPAFSSRNLSSRQHACMPQHPTLMFLLPVICNIKSPWLCGTMRCNMPASYWPSPGLRRPCSPCLACASCRHSSAAQPHPRPATCYCPSPLLPTTPLPVPPLLPLLLPPLLRASSRSTAPTMSATARYAGASRPDGLHREMWSWSSKGRAVPKPGYALACRT